MIAYAIARMIAGADHAKAMITATPSVFMLDAIAGHFLLKLINGPVLAPTLKAASMITGHDLTGWEY